MKKQLIAVAIAGLFMSGAAFALDINDHSTHNSGGSANNTFVPVNTNTQGQQQGQAQGQQQGQGQLQGQGQAQIGINRNSNNNANFNANSNRNDNANFNANSNRNSSNAVAGSVSASGSAASNDGNAQNVNISNTSPSDLKIRTVGVAPDIVSNATAPCRIAVGVSIGVMGGSGGFSSSVLDEGCDTARDVTLLRAMNETDAATVRACMKPELAQALGKKCKEAQAKTAEAPVAVKTAEVKPEVKAETKPTLVNTVSTTKKEMPVLTPVTSGNCPAGMEADPILAARGVKSCYPK